MKPATDPRAAAIEDARVLFDSGRFLEDLRRRVAFQTHGDNAEALQAYLTEEIVPTLNRLGFSCRIVPNPESSSPPFLIAERHEGDHLPTVFTYAHGDVVPGDDANWAIGRSPWGVSVEGERWYGRGTADNKGQHSINLAALDAVIAARDNRLGYNLKVLFEMGEEVSSPGLHKIAEAEKQALRADVLLASDGPRVSAARPTVFLGSRGEATFSLTIDYGKGAHHSGNWGGLLRNPATVLSHAITTLVDRNGVIQVDGLRPPPVSKSVREALSDIEVGKDAASPQIDPTWGEPGLTPTERVLAWNALEVLAIKAADADSPRSAIPARAKAVCQLRFVVGTDYKSVANQLKAHFEKHGFPEVQIHLDPPTAATRLDPEDAWVQWALGSIAKTSGKKPALIPNLGGTLPNDVFTDILGLPTLWVPHSYAGCAQHAPNEHVLSPVVREAIGIMAGLWWDLGDAAKEIVAKRGVGKPQ